VSPYSDLIRVSEDVGAAIERIRIKKLIASMSREGR
jgi:ribosomal protein L12E/L44/L45/RPP1/RPP2